MTKVEFVIDSVIDYIWNRMTELERIGQKEKAYLQIIEHCQEKLKSLKSAEDQQKGPQP